MTATGRIEAGKVPAHVRRRVDQRELDHWQSLSDSDRIGFYDAAIYEHRRSHAFENGFINNLRGQGKSDGRGGCLVDAIQAAWSRSQAARDERNTAQQALRDAPRMCSFCKIEQHGNEVSSFCGTLICHNCWWEKDPKNAEKFQIRHPSEPRPVCFWDIRMDDGTEADDLEVISNNDLPLDPEELVTATAWVFLRRDIDDTDGKIIVPADVRMPYFEEFGLGRLPRAAIWVEYFEIYNRYVVRRAAQVSHEHGYDHFIIHWDSNQSELHLTRKFVPFSRDEMEKELPVM